MKTITKKIALALLTFYRVCVSPALGPHCRFYPSCSAYASEAIERHGVVTGVRLALQRLARCHPWHVGGVDPVPEVLPHSSSATETAS